MNGNDVNPRPTSELRLSSRSNGDVVELRFLQHIVALEPDQARELVRELTHSIARAELCLPQRFEVFA